MLLRKYLIGGLATLIMAALVGAGAYYAIWSNPADGPVVAQQTETLCAQQTVFGHLGVFNGYVAVYEGPLGRHDRVLRVERIQIRELTPACQRKLEQAMEFAAQSPETQARLRQDLEFETEQALHAMLENLDELQD